MRHSTWRGNKIEYVNSIWIYSADNVPVSEDPDRKCGYCGKPQKKEGHDSCIGTLSNVSNACCGHGEKRLAYIQYKNGDRISGERALDEIKRIKK